MNRLLTSVGINEFENAIYKFDTKCVDLLGDGDPMFLTPQIETWELEGGYRYLQVLIKVDDNWSTTFSANYNNEELFDCTKVADYIAEQLVHKVNLSFMDGFEEDDSYYFTAEYSESKEVLQFLLELLGDINIESKEKKDLSYMVYAPFKAFNQLKDNIEENVKDRADLEEVKEVMVIFMEYHGEDYRSVLFGDCKLIFRDEYDLELIDLIEDVMFESFSEDEVLI